MACLVPAITATEDGLLNADSILIPTQRVKTEPLCFPVLHLCFKWEEKVHAGLLGGKDAAKA